MGFDFSTASLESARRRDMHRVGSWIWGMISTKVFQESSGLHSMLVPFDSVASTHLWRDGRASQQSGIVPEVLSWIDYMPMNPYNVLAVCDYADYLLELSVKLYGKGYIE